MKLKTNKTSIKGQREKKSEIKITWTKLEKIIYDKLGLNDEIKNK